MPTLTRFMYLPNAGHGKPDRYPIISPKSSNPRRIKAHDMPANYKMSAVNARHQSENFVVFANPADRFTDEVPGINESDLINLFDFIFTTVYQRLFAEGVSDNRLIVELDISSCDDAVIRMIDRLNGNRSDSIVTSLGEKCPMGRALADELRHITRVTGETVELALVYRRYTASECRAYFFPECHGECHCGRE